MADLSKTTKQAEQLSAQVEQAVAKLNITAKQADLKALQIQSLEPDFWADNQKAQETSKQVASLDQQVTPWVSLQQELADIAELLQLGGDLTPTDIDPQLKAAEQAFIGLKEQLKFTGKYDSYDVILSVYAGAGGTDAQDWAQMLLRMYTRWADTSGAKVTLLDESRGDEAGLKSASISIAGTPFLYGQLKGEHGVHRLVRLSPFNSDNLRQTSFAKVDVIPSIDKPTDVVLDDGDLKIDTYRASGNGGQSVNTTDSAVRITHVPTGITVSIQNEKSQLQNKETALKILRSRIAQLQLEQHTNKVSELKGPKQANEWGSQIRNYVLHPYKMVKDVRTGYESPDPDKILDGDLNEFIAAYLEQIMGQ